MSLILLFEGVKFDPSKSGYENPDKRKMAEAVVKMLKKTIELSNATLVKNTDCQKK